MCVFVSNCCVFVIFTANLDSHCQLGQVPQSLAYGLLLKLTCTTLHFLLLQLLWALRDQQSHDRSEHRSSTPIGRR